MTTEYINGQKIQRWYIEDIEQFDMNFNCFKDPDWDKICQLRQYEKEGLLELWNELSVLN